MIKLILKVFFRQAQRNKAFYFTSFALLIIGISSWNFLWSYIIHELEYDQFHVNKDQIYRLRNDRYKDGEVYIRDVVSYPAIASYLKEQLPEIKNYVRLVPFSNSVNYNGKEINVKQRYFSDPDFFSIFSFPLLKGNKETCLTGTGKVVISKSLADKLFGNEEPLGKEVFMGESAIVTGVFDDSQPSHMDIDMLLPMQTYLSIQGEDMNLDWYSNLFITYLLIDEHADYTTTSQKVNETLLSHISEFRPDQEEKFYLQKLTDNIGAAHAS